MPEKKHEAQANHYLLCNYYFSNTYIKRLKSGVKAFMYKRDKDDLYFSFMNWYKRENEIVVLTMYAYADLPLPIHFDIIFQIDNPEIYYKTDFEVKYAIFNGWAPMDLISAGHKHILVLEFKDVIPDIIHLLSDYNEKNKNNINLGFCNQSVFEEVKRSLLIQD